MWKKLFELFRGQVFLARDVQENKETIACLRHELDELSELVVKLQFEIQSLREEDRHEREKNLLKIENALLRFEKLLPPASDTKSGSSALLFLQRSCLNLAP
jgi:FtsZ-binding cell division protein ZapB